MTLGQLAPGIVAGLYRRVNFPAQGSSATLTGETWLLQSGARPFDRYEARYDGAELRQTQSKATVFGAKPPSRATSHTTTHRNVVTKSSVTVEAVGNGARSTAAIRRKLDRLVACSQSAQGDLSKIVACQQRYAP